MLCIVRRAKTTLGLLVQYAKLRWSRLGRGFKLLLLATLVVGGLAALQYGACLFGACPAGPCSLDEQPCHGAYDSDEPCPYSGSYEAPAPEPSEDVPPCHAR